MWIRSQDKTKLIKAEFIRISGNEIVATCSNTPATKIGEYSSQEKALKVLDMIQSQINMNEEFATQGEQINGTCGSIRLLKFVYQMPLDSEVLEND